MKVNEISCKSALHRLNNTKLPYKWDLNIYRGCGNGCKYCYALYSHKYMESEDFFDSLYVKTNIVEQLEKDLKKKSWKNEIINIGGVTDSYQKSEETYQFMPEILKLLIKYRNPAIISTKSDLVLRDFDLIDQLSKLTYINIAATITTTDPTVSMKLEPGAVSPERRFNMLKKFSRTNASVGVHLMPVIPLLTDSYESLNNIFSKAKDSGVDYVLPGTLYLRGKTKPYFFEFIQKEFSVYYNKLQELYKEGSLSKDYKKKLYETINILKTKYKLSSNFSKPIKDNIKKPEDRYYNNLLF